MGVVGACRCNELTNMAMEDIQDKGLYLLVSLPNTKTTSRTFTVLAEGFSVNVVDIFKRYINLRPESMKKSGRFFLRYANGKCTMQPIGINTLSKVPSIVAAFLNLPDAECYTGHCMRRSSATLLVNAGGDLITLKRHGAWKSSSVAEGYVQDSVSSKLAIAKKIQNQNFIKIAESRPHTIVESSSESSSLDAYPSPTVSFDQNNKILSVNINLNLTFNK